jgi:hypothetical protein
VTKNRINGWKSSIRERAKRGRRQRAELAPIAERRDRVVADMFPVPVETPPMENRQQRRARQHTH